MPGSRVDALSAISHPSNAQVASWEVGIARRRACLVGRASSSALRSFRGLARRSGLFRSLPFSKRRKRCGRNCAKMRLPSREGFKVSPAIAAYSGLIRSLSLSNRRKRCGRNCAKTRFPVVGDASRSALRSLRTRGLFAPFPCPIGGKGAGGIARRRAFPLWGMLQGQPCDRCALGAFSLPSLVQASLARSGSEKARPLRGWAFLGGEGGIRTPVTLR